MTILDQIKKTDERFAAGKNYRQAVQKFLTKGGDWREIESPERLRERLSQLNMRSAIAKVMEEDPSSPEAFNPLERIINASELMGVSYLYEGARVAQTVGRMIIRSGSTVLGYGTGFLVSPNLVLTNNHVLRSRDEATSSLLEMNYRETGDGGISDSLRFQLQPGKFFFYRQGPGFFFSRSRAGQQQRRNVVGVWFEPPGA